MASSKFVSSWRLFLGCCIFSCVCLIITTPGVDALAFLKKPPIFLRSFLGLNLKINCSTDDPNATVSLFHRKNLFDTPVERTPSPNRVLKIGQVFYILNLIVHDAGVYTCKANNGIQSIKWPDNTGMTFLNSAQLPEYFVLKPDKPIIIRTGQEGKVVCESVGTSVAKLQWKKQVGPFDSAVDTLVPDSMVTEIKDVATNRISATLTISNAKQDDAGTYKCVLSVLDKSATKPVSVEVRDPSVPVIQPYTGPTTIEEGTEKFLKCTATAFPKPTITWYKDGQQLNTTICITSSDQRKCDGITYDISEDDLSSQIHSFGKLKIQSALYPRDQGEFKCVASNGFYSANLVIVLDVQAAPRLIKNLNAKLVKKDEESKVVCTVERSNPWPTFQWKYQAMSCPDLQKGCTPDPLQWKSIPAEPSSQVPTNQSVVTVARDVQNTFYLCQAINVVGNDSQVTRLVRTDIQKYIELDRTVATEFNERSIMRLPCIDRCFFMCSNIHFTRDGKKLLPENDARINVTQEQSDNARVILTIKNLTLNDSGNYRCVGIENPPLYDSVNITIKALKKPVIRSLIVKANYGKPVELLCPATANPPADITWSLLKDDGTEQTITESNDLGGNTNACVSRASGYFYLRAYDHSHLVICNPKHEDHSGRYTCHAENIAGSSSASALLDVYFAPTIITPSDGFRKTLDFGDELNVTCTAKANPHATVTWITNTTDQRQVLEKGVGSVQLFISSVDEEDYKRYKCVASNSYGTATAFLTVEKVGVIEFANDKHLLSVPAMVGIAVGVGVFVLLLLVVGCFLYRRQKKQMDEYKELYFLRNTDYKIDPDRSLLEQCNDLPYDPDWEFPEERLILGDVIGSGAFGQVIKAEAIGIVAFNPRDKAPESFKRRSKIRRSTRAKDLTREHVAGGEKSLKTPVAVKTLKDGAAEAEYKDLASELKILIHLGQHKNIINLLGACTRGKRLMVIMEFAPHGSFLSFIRAKREIYDATWTKTTNNPEQEFTLVDLAMAAYQISRGMAFLASKKCVHRDLAARNILVGSDYVMKIADFGLARDIYKNDLYVKTTSGLLPVKWMAPESLFDRVYTEKTDVWSFGILLWEAFTLGGTPYPGLPTEQLLDYLSDGKRMEMPARCPVELYTIMRDCWLHDPAQRPAFTSLNERLGKVLERNLTKDNPYIALQMAEEDEEEYGQGYYLQPCESGIRESKRYVESPVHTPDEEGTAAPRFDKGASEADWEDDTRYGSPLPPLPPGLGIISDDDMRNAPLPPIPASHQEPFSDKEGGDEFGPRRESGIELDYAADSGEYIGDLIGKSPDPSRDGSKPVAIQVDGVGKLPEVKSKGTGREEDETKV